MVMPTACLEINPERRSVIVRTEDGKKLGELDLDDLAEIVEFRYATPGTLQRTPLRRWRSFWKTLRIWRGAAESSQKRKFSSTC